ncbi:hypothetical protein [Bradyrhizobium sp.]|uniref:hypothetical protein n=1 Tax=Bradyrhizobium sp. TaxID=376 RepID=UPI003C607DCE
MLSGVAPVKWRAVHGVVLAGIVLAVIFWGNLFRFHPLMIDRSYDDTSEQLVIGRMARSTADGLTSGNADVGLNYFPDQDRSTYYDAQQRYFEDPSLIHAEHPLWGPYPSHFGLQGIVFSLIDAVDPLPRKLRIGFYHFLASLFAAGVLVWIADILRRRFGWPAFFGFLIPVALEPMFSALAPNLYWVVGTWFIPMAVAMLLADEDEPRRRARLILLVFLFILVKCLCGYEFTSTVILAAAVGCLLGVRDTPDRLSRMLGNVTWTVSAGVAGFVVAAFAHAARQGGFAVLATKAANRMTGDATSLQDELLFGKFASIGSVLATYLGSNFIALIKSFGVLLALLTVTALLSLLDGRLNWWLGTERRKLQILALAFLASLAAPLSWFVLAKAHSFVHPHIDMIMWYLPTIPLGCALVGVALAQTIEHAALWRADLARSFMTAAIPLVVIGGVVAIYFADRTILTQATWAISEHANGVPIFETTDHSLDFRMTGQWFMVSYECRVANAGETFFIRTEDGDNVHDAVFRLADKQVFSMKGKCIAAEPKTDQRFQKIHFGQTSDQRVMWEREVKFDYPDTLTTEPLTNVDWDRGISRSSGTELLVPTETFAGLFLRKGDHVQLPASESHTVTGIVPLGPSTVITLDGPPIRLAEGIVPSFGISRNDVKIARPADDGPPAAGRSGPE